MKNMTTFQLAIIGVFMFSIVLGVLVFSGVIPGIGGGDRQYGGEVLLWGTLPARDTRTFFDNFNRAHEASFRVIYEEKDERTFEQELVEALAAGTGPDLVILPHDLLLKHENKIAPIPFEAYPERTFKDTFIEEGELFVSADGVLGVPFLIDPIVMYWNRDILSSEGIAQVPQSWSQVLAHTPRLARVDDNGNVLRAVVPFGDFANNEHAKELLSLLILQTGNDIVARGEEGYEAVLDEASSSNALSAPESAVQYFMEFSNAAKPVYTWNRALPDARDMFVAGDLALYFGYAGELQTIVAQNPHLNFDVAAVPQVEGGTRMTYGALDALVVTRKSENAATALRVVFALTDPATLQTFTDVFALPPVRRDLLATAQTDAYKSVFYDSALISRGWLDPDPEASQDIFRRMTESIASGRARLSGAVRTANDELFRLVN